MRRWRVAALMLTAVSLSLTAGHERPLPPAAPPARPAQQIRPLPTPDEAVRLALADAAAHPVDAPFLRYLWWPSMDDREARAASLALNIVSRSPVLRRPPAVTGYLLRVDLRAYAPQAQDLQEWLGLWEDFQFDPAFCLLITPDELDSLSPRDRQRVTAQRRPAPAPVAAATRPAPRAVDSRLGYRCSVTVTLPEEATLTIAGETLRTGGRVREFVSPELPRLNHTYEYQLAARLILPSGEAVTVERTVDVQAGFRTNVEIIFPGAPTAAAVVKDTALLRLDSDAIDPIAFGQLQQLTGSNAPVVSAAYFCQRALTTVKDKGLYADLFGGRYYELAGIRKARDVKGKEKATDEDLFLESVGVGNIAAGVTAQKLFEGLRSDQRIATFRSGVTGKPRRVDMFHSLAGRESMGWVSVTHDLRDQDIDIGKHPVANLLDFRDEAREDIADKPNGLHYYALFDGKGKLLDEAAPDVAADRTIPPPNSMRLQSALSCIACHEADGSDGWKTLQNDVTKLMAGKLDIFTDVSNRGALQADAIDRLAGLYAGDFTRNLIRARDDYALATLKASGPWADSDDQVRVVKAAAGYLVDHVRGYQLGLVDARQALRELGLEVPGERAVAVLGQVLPPDPESRIGDLFPEDPRLGALKQGLAIPRSDWALVYGFAARRSQAALTKLRGVKP